MSVSLKVYLAALSYTLKRPVVIITDSCGGRLLLREDTGIARNWFHWKLQGHVDCPAVTAAFALLQHAQNTCRLT